MDALFFTLKTLGLTFVIVLLMQIRWSDQTIETDTYDFLTSSRWTAPIDDAAHGAVVLVRNSWVKINKSINSNFMNSIRNENQPGQRHLQLGLDRSKQYIEQATKKLEQNAEARRMDFEINSEEKSSAVKESTSSMVERFKSKVTQVGRSVRGGFIDETVVPHETKKVQDRSRAKSTDDDEMIIDQ